MANHACPEVNTSADFQQGYWDLTAGGPLDAHKIGWIICGGVTAITVVICLVASYQHARNYHKPAQQRQIIRILWMPMVFAIINFFAFRYFRAYTYYELVVIVYEALVLMAFLALMLAYVGESSDRQKEVLRMKEKRGLPWPLGFVKFRPSKPYFLHALNASVLQYAFFRPLITVIGIVCEVFHVLCAHQMAPWFAKVYLDAFDFVSISIALYGLIVLYVLVEDLLRNKKPVAKFMSIKMLVFFTYYQAFAFDAIAQNGVIASDEYTTVTNVSEGLNAMTICVEMVVFSALMWWAYPVSEYKAISRETNNWTNPCWAFWQAINYADFVREFGRGFMFLCRYASGADGTRSLIYSSSKKHEFDIGAAFRGTGAMVQSVPARAGTGVTTTQKATYHEPDLEKADSRLTLADSDWTVVDSPTQMTPKAQVASTTNATLDSSDAAALDDSSAATDMPTYTHVGSSVRSSALVTQSWIARSRPKPRQSVPQDVGVDEAMSTAPSLDAASAPSTSLLFSATAESPDLRPKPSSALDVPHAPSLASSGSNYPPTPDEQTYSLMETPEPPISNDVRTMHTAGTGTTQGNYATPMSRLQQDWVPVAPTTPRLPAPGEPSPPNMTMPHAQERQEQRSLSKKEPGVKAKNRRTMVLSTYEPGKRPVLSRSATNFI